MMAEPAATDRATLCAPRRCRRLVVGALALGATAAAWWLWAQSASAVSAAQLRIAEVVTGDPVRDVQTQGRQPAPREAGRARRSVRQ